MSQRVLLFLLLFALAGCGDKPAARTEPKHGPENALVPSIQDKFKDAPKVDEPKPKPKVEPEVKVAVPVSPEDKARVEAAEKKGATVFDGPNGGYEIRIEATADAAAILALLRGTKCVVGLSAEGESLTDAALRHAGGFEYLEQITLHKCPNLTGTGFDALAKHTRLKTLAVSECPIANEACKHLGTIQSLEEVRFIRTKVTDDGLKELAGLPALEALALEGTPVTGTAFAASGWPKLRDIDAPNGAINDAGMKALAGLTALRNLHIDGCKITDAGLYNFRTATKLVELSMSNTKITDTGLRELKNFDSLRVLDVSNTVIQGISFGTFTLRPNLRKLIASDTHFDDEGAKNLAKFPGLTTLALANTKVTDAGLVALKDMKNLANCDLSKTGAGDDTAKLLGALLELTEANFAHTKLTDVGVKALASGMLIRQIDARGTKVTHEGADRAQMGRPRVEIRVR